MNHKSSLALIEQVIMMLVLAVAAAVCLQIFVHAGTQTHKSKMKDQAFYQAQNCAEILKSTGGDMAQTAAITGASATADGLQLDCDGITVTVVEINTDTPYLGMAAVSAYAGQELLCTLDVCWQEVAP